MAQKRSQDQQDFDLTKHGWAFCSSTMLRGRIPRLKQIANRLQSDDPRHEELMTIIDAAYPGRITIVDEHNPFLALAKTLWARGDDGEVIARDLANALTYVIAEGTKAEPVAEFIRLTSQA